MRRVDENKKIVMPSNINKKPRREFKFKRLVAWVLLIALLIGYGNLVKADGNRKGKEDNYVTEFQWFSMLADSFGDAELLNKSFDSNKKVKGKDAVVSAIDELDAEWLVSFIGKEDFCDEDCIALAVKNDIITPSYLTKYLTVEEAKEVILNTMGVYFDPQNYPKYFDMKTIVPNYDADNWDIQEIDEENSTITAFIDEVPEVGGVVIYRDEYGIAKAKYIDDIDEEKSGLYKIKLTEVEDLSEIMETVSFSGAGDFSYLIGREHDKPEKAEQNNSLTNGVACVINPMEVAYDWGSYTALDEESITKCDSIELKISIGTDGIKTEGEIKNGRKTDKITCEYWSPEEKKDMNISAAVSLKLEGISICASGYYQWADPGDEKNNVSVRASADKVSLNVVGKVDYKDKIEVWSYPIPVAPTGGVISVDFVVYLVFSAKGEVTVEYGIKNPYVGVGISVGEGLKYEHGSDGKFCELSTKMELSTKLVLEPDVKLVGFNIMAPAIDIEAVADITPVVAGDNYEYKPEYSLYCSEMKIQAPIVKLRITGETDSLASRIVKKIKMETTIDLIQKDAPDDALFKPWKKIFHLEIDNDGILNLIDITDAENLLYEDSPHDRVCTHIVRKEPLDELEENPDATDEEEKADPIHFGGIVLEPEDIVLKMYDALHEGDYETAASCLEPEWEMGINILGNLASALVELITGEDYSWGQILLETAGATDVEVIDIYADNYVMESSVSFLNEWIPNIPGINKLVCTEADVHIKYRYRYNGHCKIETDECHVRRHGFLGWRVDVE